MKDSGIEWIGEIPKEWEVCRLKNVFTLKTGTTPKEYETISSKDKYINWFTPSDIDNSNKVLSYSQRKLAEELIVKEGIILYPIESILFVGIGATAGKVGYMSKPGYSNQQITALVPRKGFSKFFFYILIICKDYIKDNAFYTTLPIINNSYLSGIETIFPSLSEQQRIVTFLDGKCKDIDTLITLQEEMIAELQAYKQSVISEAVTKGLNPNVMMKDSGVEWIGEIPKHWNSAHLNYFVSKVGSGSTPRGGSNIYVKEGIKFLRSQNVYFEGLELTDVAYITPEIHEEMKNTRVRPGDVLLNITGGSIGRCYYVDSKLGEANVNQHVCIIRPTKMNSVYLKYFLQSSLGQIQIDRLQTGGNREGLSAAALKKFLVFDISLTEQQAIADYLDTKCAQIDELIALKQQKITSLQDYKKSLIYEYVTGKKEVPDNN